jgi:hypothetical protein
VPARRPQVKPLVQGESACKPASVPGSPPGGGHPSGAGVAAGLMRSTRGLGRASLRGRVAAAGASPIRPCSGWGLPSRPVTRPLVRSYRTVSPLPTRASGPAVCSLWHFPAGRPDWRLASTLPCGGRTFLDPGEPGPRPPSRLPLPDHCATPKWAGGASDCSKEDESIHDRTYVRVSWHETCRVGSRQQMNPQPAYRWLRHGTMPDLEHRHRLARFGVEDD